ncbi:MAG: hypothetical protein IJH13_02055 [Bacilli bacterium]|nr:hypothetical protein [Bacilli bacterium]
MEVVRVKGESDYSYTIIDNNKSLNIFFDKYLNPYFTCKNLEKEDKYILFHITEEDYSIYTIFDNLYRNLTKEVVDEKKKRKCKNKRHGKAIVFESDNDIFSSINEKEQQSNSLIIAKEETDIIMQFNYKNNINNTIRVDNSKNQYNHFKEAFIEFYDDLQNYDPEYHQMHIKEYKYLTKKIRK